MLNQSEKMNPEERIKELEAELASYKLNGAIGLYYELNRLVNQAVLFSRGKTIQSLIAGDEKADKTFERFLALIKSAKDNVIDMEEIKAKLNLTGDEDKDRIRKPFIDRIADKRD